jgi:hypothetical protein
LRREKSNGGLVFSYTHEAPMQEARSRLCGACGLYFPPSMWSNSMRSASGSREMIESPGCRLVYLPPYYPDFSPIENIWPKVKQTLRSVGARQIASLEHAIESALAAVTVADCRSWVTACGYALHLT